MQLDRAIDHLAEIHSQLARSEVFHGYRSRAMAATSVLALAAAAAQGAAAPDATGFVVYWVTVAAFGLAICGVDLMWSSWRRRERADRRRVLHVVAQLGPAFAAGAVFTAVLAQPALDVPGLLPGAWAMIFGLAVFASRPFLARGVGWVGLWYCAAGTLLLALADPRQPSAWAMGLTFGVGQGLAAIVLRRGPQVVFPPAGWTRC